MGLRLGGSEVSKTSAGPGASARPDGGVLSGACRTSVTASSPSLQLRSGRRRESALRSETCARGWAGTGRRALSSPERPLYAGSVLRPRPEPQRPAALSLWGLACPQMMVINDGNDCTRAASLGNGNTNK